MWVLNRRFLLQSNKCVQGKTKQKRVEMLCAVLPVRPCEEQTNSTLRGSWMLVMLTVPLQGCWETYSLSSAASPDSEFLSSLSLVTSARRAERFSPETEKKITIMTDYKSCYYSGRTIINAIKIYEDKPCTTKYIIRKKQSSL